MGRFGSALFALCFLSACIGAPTEGPIGGGLPPPGAPDPFPTFTGLLNGARTPIGLNPLTISAPLMATAQGHADDMSSNGFFSHTGTGGSTLGTRLTAQSYNYCWAGENIAQGHSTNSATFTAWMNSPGHQANMLSSQPTEFGLALAPAGNYRVLVLARPGC
ncbi:MAG: CAP domain-containing protein [Paracoccaceae bacterium]